MSNIQLLLNVGFFISFLYLWYKIRRLRKLAVMSHCMLEMEIKILGEATITQQQTNNKVGIKKKYNPTILKNY